MRYARFNDKGGDGSCRDHNFTSIGTTCRISHRYNASRRAGSAPSGSIASGANSIVLTRCFIKNKFLIKRFTGLHRTYGSRTGTLIDLTDNLNVNLFYGVVPSAVIGGRKYGVTEHKTKDLVVHRGRCRRCNLNLVAASAFGKAMGALKATKRYDFAAIHVPPRFF